MRRDKSNNSNQRENKNDNIWHEDIHAGNKNNKNRRTKLVVEGNAVYEVDLECLECKEREEGMREKHGTI